MSDETTITEPEGNLQTEGASAIISDSGNTSENAQGNVSPEDTHTASVSVIEQQASTIDLLMEQNARLQSQIEKLLRSGAQINDGNSSNTGQHTAQNPFGGFGGVQNGYVDERQAFCDLGKEIGKKS